jgi:hypothetical protein
VYYDPIDDWNGDWNGDEDEEEEPTCDGDCPS